MPSPSYPLPTNKAAGNSGFITDINQAYANINDLNDRVEATENSDVTQGKAVSTDGSFSLPTPTGVGLEFIIAADALDDIQMNGASL